MFKIDLDSLDFIKDYKNIPATDLNFDIVDYYSISYYKFFKKYLYKNRPCIVQSISNDWNCRNNWITDSNQINFNYLNNHYGKCQINVSETNKECRKLSLSGYIDYWQELLQKDYADDLPLLYLKDWHFMKEFPNENIYTVPSIFASDWLNEYYLETLDDDFRFVYMGPKGTGTLLHEDVYTSFSWSVNLSGKKKWLFFPPGEQRHFTDRFGLVINDVNSSELNEKYKFPNYNKDKLKCIELIQNTGDAVFVPSGWYHQVTNLEDTLSVNQNWINGCNLHSVWKTLNDNFLQAQKEIEDCRDSNDWLESCQNMLKASFGMNHRTFIQFMCYICEKRINAVKTETDVNLPGGWYQGRIHSKFDLFCIKPVLNDLISNFNFDLYLIGDLKEQILNYLNVINEIYSDDVTM